VKKVRYTGSRLSAECMVGVEGVEGWVCVTSLRAVEGYAYFNMVSPETCGDGHSCVATGVHIKSDYNFCS
jgi:hypothetical protein